jgi:hypothetical protein
MVDPSGTLFRFILLQLSARAYFGWRPGSPPGVPGGGMIGILPPPRGGTEMPGSTPAGGHMMPFDSESCWLRLPLPVVSFGVKVPVPSPGGHCRSAGAFGGSPCADAAEPANVAMATATAARFLNPMCLSHSICEGNVGRDAMVPLVGGRSRARLGLRTNDRCHTVVTAGFPASYRYRSGRPITFSKEAEGQPISARPPCTPSCGPSSHDCDMN